MGIPSMLLKLDLTHSAKITTTMTNLKYIEKTVGILKIGTWPDWSRKCKEDVDICWGSQARCPYEERKHPRMGRSKQSNCWGLKPSCRSLLGSRNWKLHFHIKGLATSGTHSNFNALQSAMRLHIVNTSSCHFTSLWQHVSWGLFLYVWWGLLHPSSFCYTPCNVPDALCAWCFPSRLPYCPHIAVWCGHFSSKLPYCSRIAAWCSSSFLYILLFKAVSHVFACCCMLGHIHLYDVVDGESLMPPLYFRICPRSAIDLMLTHFSSLLQCLPLGCLLSIYVRGRPISHFPHFRFHPTSRLELRSTPLFESELRSAHTSKLCSTLKLELHSTFTSRVTVKGWIS